MVHVSKKSLNIKIEQQLLDQFSNVFANRAKNETKDLLSALLSESERTMLIKRLASVLLIQEHSLSTYEIAKRLHMSEATIRTMKLQAEGGKFDALYTICKRKSFNQVLFWKVVEQLLSGGLPPRTKDRWKSIRL
jgi:Trp operon repressor